MSSARVTRVTICSENATLTNPLRGRTPAGQRIFWNRVFLRTPLTTCHCMNTLLSAEDEKKHAAISSVLWSFLLTVIKLIAGFATNSLGILSEALHSALDLVAAGITFFSVRYSAKPADREHPYGHGKIENLSALLQTVLLLATSLWIVYEALDRLFFSKAEVRMNIWALGVIVVSILVDISRARMLKRVAEKHRSQALEADALHFSTDILSSLVVLVGLAGLWLAPFFPPDSVARMVCDRADALAALVVSAIVLWVGLSMCRRAVTLLLDGGAGADAEKLRRVFDQHLPLYTVRTLRARDNGGQIFADVCLEAPGELSFEGASEIRHLAEMVAKDAIPGLDITVQLVPRHSKEAGLLDTVYAVALAHDVPVHSVFIQRRPDGLCVYVHVEAPSLMSLAEAHAKVDAFEKSLARRIGAVRIDTHIEPDSRVMYEELLAHECVDPKTLLENINAVLAKNPNFPAAHNAEAYMVAGQQVVSFHSLADGRLSVAEAHELASHMEHVLRAHMPGVDRLLIHMEPLPDLY